MASILNTSKLTLIDASNRRWNWRFKLPKLMPKLDGLSDYWCQIDVKFSNKSCVSFTKQRRRENDVRFICKSYVKKELNYDKDQWTVKLLISNRRWFYASKWFYKRIQITLGYFSLHLHKFILVLFSPSPQVSQFQIHISLCYLV